MWVGILLISILYNGPIVIHKPGGAVMKAHHLYPQSRNRVNLPLVVLILCFLSAGAASAFEADTLKQARQLFYDSVENSKSIEKAMVLFEKIGAHPSHEGLALTYIGALIALKGKFAFFPLTKYRRALKGIELMDAGIAKNPHQIEARFIRGMTCYYLPFFFHRKEIALNDFQILIRQLKDEYHQYDAGIVRNIIAFLLENVPMTDGEMTIVKNVQSKLENED